MADVHWPKFTACLVAATDGRCALAPFRKFPVCVVTDGGCVLAEVFRVLGDRWRDRCVAEVYPRCVMTEVCRRQLSCRGHPLKVTLRTQLGRNTPPEGDTSDTPRSQYTSDTSYTPDTSDTTQLQHTSDTSDTTRSQHTSDTSATPLSTHLSSDTS